MGPGQLVVACQIGWRRLSLYVIVCLISGCKCELQFSGYKYYFFTHDMSPRISEITKRASSWRDHYYYYYYYYIFIYIFTCAPAVLAQQVVFLVVSVSVCLCLCLSMQKLKLIISLCNLVRICLMMNPRSDYVLVTFELELFCI